MANELRERILQLKELLDLGLLSEEEYQAQKAALLASVMGTTPTPANAPLGGTTTLASTQPAAGGALAGTTSLDSSAMLPTQIGNYRILSLIGAGGMGTVMRARHLEEGWARRQGGDVALKLIHPHIAEDPNFRERFLDEAQLGRRIQHPGLAAVYDVVVSGRWLGTVMDLVEGRSLERLVVPGGMAVADTLGVLRPLAAALDALHGQGIVHRDLKPSNIKVRPDGLPVILDLGIAKDLNSSADHTRTMTAMGTTRWMAPEQADAKRAGPEADRYALGLIAYALLTGRLPWDAELSELRIVTLKMTGRLLPIARVHSDLPNGVAAAVMAMLALEPEARPDSCEAFVAALAGDKSIAAPANADVAGPDAAVDHAGLAGASLGQLLLYATWREDAPAMGGWSRAQVLAVLEELEQTEPRWGAWEADRRSKADEREAHQQLNGRAQLVNLLRKRRRRCTDQEIDTAKRRAEVERARAEAAKRTTIEQGQEDAVVRTEPEQVAETFRGRRHFEMAQKCWGVGDYRGAVMQMRFAMQFEPDNEAFTEWLEKAKKARQAGQGQREETTNGRPELAAKTLNGRKHFEMAQKCLGDGDYRGAVMQMRFAAQYEPDNEVFTEWLEKAKEARQAGR